MIIIENCPICNNLLECITNEKGYVIDWFCNKCSISWTLDDLEHESIQQNLDKWIKGLRCE